MTDVFTQMKGRRNFPPTALIQTPPTGPSKHALEAGRRRDPYHLTGRLAGIDQLMGRRGPEIKALILAHLFRAIAQHDAD